MPRASHVDTYAKLFGEIVQDLRWGRRWTLNDLGRHAEMHPDYLGRVERGLNIPSLHTILRLAEVFDVPAATLIEPLENHRKALRPYARAKPE